MSDEVQAVVIDNDSYMIRAGFAGVWDSRSVFQSIVGRQKFRTCTNLDQKKDPYAGEGDEAWTKAGILIRVTQSSAVSSPTGTT